MIQFAAIQEAYRVLFKPADLPTDNLRPLKRLELAIEIGTKIAFPC